MILGEKIMELRKRNSWSQEDLAGRLNVSRQSVSKWESSMSVPDLDKILQLSEIFEVSTDYLLKDNQEEEYVPGNPDGIQIRKLTMEEAHTFIRIRSIAGVRIALGVVACILSPVPLILLDEVAEEGRSALSAKLADGLGLAALLLIIAGAVISFIINGIGLGKYEWLETEDFDLCYGVAGMVQEKCETEAALFTMKIAAGVGLCIAGVIPLIVAGIVDAPERAQTMGVLLLLVAVAAGAYLFISAGMKKGAYDQLLQVGNYTPENKEANKAVGRIGAVYWCIVTAIYVGYSMATKSWETSWMIWPVTGILFGAIAGYIKMKQKKL